jgi:hypothetical protein
MPNSCLSASDLTMFVLSLARLSTIWIGTRYFVHLLEAAPRLVTSLADISFNEDPTWVASVCQINLSLSEYDDLTWTTMVGISLVSYHLILSLLLYLK